MSVVIAEVNARLFSECCVFTSSTLRLKPYQKSENKLFSTAFSAKNAFAIENCSICAILYDYSIVRSCMKTIEVSHRSAAGEYALCTKFFIMLRAVQKLFFPPDLQHGEFIQSVQFNGNTVILPDKRQFLLFRSEVNGLCIRNFQ